MKTKRTKRSVEAAQANGRRMALIDTEVKGFVCRITPNGARPYYLKYSRANRARWLPGLFPDRVE